MLTVLSFGAGQDSTTLLYKYIHDVDFRKKYAPEDFIVVCADTGDEHIETYRHIEDVKKLCVRFKVEFFHITPNMGFHSGSWQSLRGFYDLKKAVGSKSFPKTCTDRLKIQPIYKFLESWIGKKYSLETGRKKGFYKYNKKFGSKIKIMLGIAHGEEKRRIDPSKITEKWRKENIENLYPLIDLKMGRAECIKYIKKLNYKVPVPSNCILCPFMSEIELVWMYRNIPKDYQDWVRIEKNKINNNLNKGEKNLGVWGKKLLPEVLERALIKYGRMTLDELNDYKMSHGHCVQSKY
jgi:3'-phosphoadenosine 5'-phosphosulfate sulfotransferase (PAPS reductase)/FAD synthetase